MAGDISKLIRTSVRTLFLWQFLTTVMALAKGDYLFFEETIQSDNNVFKLKNMLIDYRTGALYVGSVNYLYKLTQSLDIDVTIETGPKQDNPECFAPPASCKEGKMTIDNINKILVINKEELIICGSVYQGRCVIRRLSDLGLVSNDSHEEIAANTIDGTSVAFIAPGSFRYDENTCYQEDVLYLATSHAKWIDLAKPTVSSRKLLVPKDADDKLFPQLEDTPNFYKSAISIPSGFLETFNIYYLYGFSNTNFSYFVAVQPNAPEISTAYETKIVQLCQCDIAYHSYIELPITCTSRETVYNIAQSAQLTTVGSKLTSSTPGFSIGEKVLMVTFSKSLPGQRTPTEESAVCMYSVKDINRKLNERRIECANGLSPYTDIPWVVSTNCPEPSKDSSQETLADKIKRDGTEYCHKEDFIQPLGGTVPIDAEAVYTDNSILMAVAATSYLEETVIFLGDHRGNLKKLRVLSSTEAALYYEEAIADKPVVQNGINFSPDKNFIYFMTERKIHKIPVEDCSTHTTCTACLGVGEGTGDPYCGWCSLQKRCTRRNESECAMSEDQSNLRWLGDLEQCIEIKSVEPPIIPSNKTQELLLTVKSLPRLDPLGDSLFQCKFGDIALEDATVNFMGNTSEVRCITPRSSRLPLIVEGFLRVQLSIHSTETGLDIVGTDFDFYDCSMFVSCTTCISNEYRCDWCVFENKCVGDSTGCELVATKQPEGGVDMCPRIVDDGREILIAAGVRTEFQVSTANLPIPKVNRKRSAADGNYRCVLKYEGLTVTVPADRVNESSLSFQSTVYEYSSAVSDLPVVLEVYWGDNIKIDNPEDVSVNLYKCDEKRSNCGNCLAAPAKYQCGWCNVAEASCRLNVACGASDRVSDLCPNPQITEFSPTSGFVSGGAYLVIRGINLGLRIEDIVNVTVAGETCVLLRTDHIVATQLACIVKYSKDPKEGKVVVRIRNSNGTETAVATSPTPFRYVIPKLKSVMPAFGPASGGTKITITGSNMDAGSAIITVIGGPVCKLISRSSDSLVCETPPGAVGAPTNISMMFDTAAINDTLSYQYRQDPIIINFDRYSSIKSGGLDIVVEGKNLDVIQQPKIQFTIGNKTLIQPCDPPTDTRMTCPSPDTRGLPTDGNPYSTLEVNRAFYGFILDGVMNFTSFADMAVIQTFEFYPDPVYYKFSENNNPRKLNLDQTKILEIQGDNLTLAYQEGDVKVSIGEGECKDVTLNVARLTCTLPDAQPASRTSAKFPSVVVYHGNLNFTIGQLEYIGENFLDFILIGAGVLILIIIIIVIIRYSYYKAFAKDTIVKQMEAQRDQLELQVAQECRETFAELQTDMTILTGDLEAIPYREYHNYCIKTLFPDQPNHSVLKELALAGASRTNIEKGLVQFEQLMSNKQFLLVFVRTLEEQKTFSQKDKSNVASLMMVALQGKMDYSTTILKILLADLIEKHVEKDRARLLMRRNESVAEKMVSNWLSFLLYNFIREKAGEPLFKLFYAIKQQMEKGPVDAITGEARYGLSEVKVIRQQIPYKVMSIFAIGLDKDAEPVSVRVLDYDTILQVKEKILDALYKTTPHSHRPPKEELDLECRYDKGRILLQDDDGRTDGEWKRLNMLCNYSEIREGATIALVPKQGFTMSGFTNPKYMLQTANSPARSMTTPMLAADTDMNGTKLWHLVKPSDSDYHKSGDKDHKMMAEIYLPRLLTTKGVLQTFVDDLFEMIFSVNHRGNTLPLCIKYLFDFLDDQAKLHLIQNNDVVHSWKSNSLPLRFWVNLIKNPNIIFDIYKSETVDACLSIIGQTLMDACSVSDHPLTKDSPSSRLLYAKDIPKYKKWVERYYQDIAALPSISDQDMSAMLSEHSHTHQYDFHTNTALNELYFLYAVPYKKQIMEALEENDFNQQAEKFAKLYEDLNHTL